MKENISNIIKDICNRNTKTSTAEDIKVIDLAIKQFNSWVDIYEQALYNNKTEKESKQRIRQNNATNNPFDMSQFTDNEQGVIVKTSEDLEKICQLIRIKWFDALVTVQMPTIATGKQKRNIRRNTLRRFNDGKYQTSKSVETIYDAIKRLTAI